MEVIQPNEFKEAFDAAFLVNRKYLWWNSKKRRTAQMITYIYHTIADIFPKVEVDYEYNKIDCVFFKENESINNDNIFVAIEHENDVRGISTELNSFKKYNYPLNVLITYTEHRDLYLIDPHSELMNSIKGVLLLILNPKGYWPDEHQRGDRIPWEYFIWSNGKLEKI